MSGGEAAAREGSAVLSDLRRRTMLAALSAAVFFMTTSGSALAPFLLTIAQELGTDLAAIGNLFAIQTVSWGLVSLVAGALSDRIGRRPILVAAVLTLAVSRFGFATAGTYAGAATWQFVSGFGGGAFMGTVFAAVSDHVAPAERGRALGSVIAGQSVALLVGVPLATWVGSFWGWRGAFTGLGVATLLTALAVWITVPGGGGPVRGAGGVRLPLAVLRHPGVVALLSAGTAERVCFAAMAVYLATYLQTSYGLPLTELAVALALVAFGNLAGNVAGGLAADRIASRPLTFATSSILTAALALPLLAWQPGLVGSVALGFAYAFVNALGRPALMAELSAVPGEVRGAVLGLNITAASFGWLGASALGGWLVGRAGFAGLGWLCALAGVAGALLGVGARRSPWP